MTRLLRLFLPPPPAPPIADPAEVGRLYRQFRLRVMYTLIFGYALFYFCRKNISIAMPALAKELSLSNAQIGWINGLLYATYGIGKLANGVLGDHAYSRRFMTLGLILTALCNLGFAGSAAPVTLALWWAANGWVQSMGFPPCARLLANWYSVSERGRTWGLWNTSHQIGAFAVAGLVGYLAQRSGWRAGFTVPALLCLVGSVVLWERLRDTPERMGLPPIARHRDDPERERDGSEVSDAAESVRHILLQRVLRSPEVWLISALNFFVYAVRNGAFDFATKFLHEVKGCPLDRAGFITSTFEICGIPGSLLAGAVADRYLGGRHAPVCFVFLLLSLLGLGAFYHVPPGHGLLSAAALGLCGFGIYGPQLLVGVFATDMASRKAAATAIGLTGIIGYAGSFAGSVITGALIDRRGWGAGFTFWVVAGGLGALLTLPIWRTTARGWG